MTLTWGDPAPWFSGPTEKNPRFRLDTVAGRPVVLAFLESTEHPDSRAFLQELARERARFDDVHAAFFGVTIDPGDARPERRLDQLPGIRYVRDLDQTISRLYRAVPPGGPSPERPEGMQGSTVPCATLTVPDQDVAAWAHSHYRRFVLVLDERLRVVMRTDLTPAPEAMRRVVAALESLSQPEPPAQVTASAPVLIVPRIFEPELCRGLISYYQSHGSEDSGFMRDVGGRTVGVIDYSHKRRRDCVIEDAALREKCMFRIHDRLVPEIRKAFQFRATRMERYIVAGYEGSDGGHFRAHRDDTTLGTCHRRFAVSLNLNADEFEGGDLQFPEFGRQLYRAPTGGAVVFSCSLLHAAMPVTRGTRYVFLPFLYDDEAARVRQQNSQFVAGSAPPARAADLNRPESSGDAGPTTPAPSVEG